MGWRSTNELIEKLWKIHGKLELIRLELVDIEYCMNDQNVITRIGIVVNDIRVVQDRIVDLIDLIERGGR